MFGFFSYLIGCISNKDNVCGISRYTDMESEDYPFFQGLVYLLENDVSTLGYELTFSTEVCIYPVNISGCFVCKILVLLLNREERLLKYRKVCNISSVHALM